ncbi:hypothetical protein PILCRDRAFT_469801 [Piloderma croceum F 1598]|uniref:Uncharacterized protein n=1 Tax=Piloderma croceum (strain F 1598) TaxID=765440 RepID=A0A0C3FR28_PILCF|nr:hypothetical protein PILCRDRAFT_469801 [Piloderma croceum F 1598]
MWWFGEHGTYWELFADSLQTGHHLCSVPHHRHHCHSNPECHPKVMQAEAQYFLIPASQTSIMSCSIYRSDFLSMMVLSSSGVSMAGAVERAGHIGTGMSRGDLRVGQGVGGGRWGLVAAVDVDQRELPLDH